MMKLITWVAIAATLLALGAGCSSTGNDGTRLTTVDQLNLKREILLEYQGQLTPEQQFVIRNEQFETRDDALGRLNEFLEFNAAKAELENPDRPTSASDVVLRRADGDGDE